MSLKQDPIFRWAGSSRIRRRRRTARGWRSFRMAYIPRSKR